MKLSEPVNPRVVMLRTKHTVSTFQSIAALFLSLFNRPHFYPEVLHWFLICHTVYRNSLIFQKLGDLDDGVNTTLVSVYYEATQLSINTTQPCAKLTKFLRPLKLTNQCTKFCLIRSKCARLCNWTETGQLFAVFMLS